MEINIPPFSVYSFLIVHLVQTNLLTNILLTAMRDVTCNHGNVTSVIVK